jgi:hypothetical protein
MTGQDGSNIQSKLFELPDNSSLVDCWAAPGSEVSRQPVGCIDNSIRRYERDYHFIDMSTGHVENIESHGAITEAAFVGNDLNSR